MSDRRATAKDCKPEGDDEDTQVRSEAEERLTELRDEAQEPGPTERPPEMPLRAIKTCPEVFQPRTGREDERHVQDLARVIARGTRLDPMLVIAVGPSVYVIDGHHRFAAYEEARKIRARAVKGGGTQGQRTATQGGVKVPVRWFEGSLEEAVLEAGRANSKAKLPMTTPERMNYAWRLVVMGAFTKAKIVEAAAVSQGQVKIMRRVERKLGVEAMRHRYWWQAQEAAKGQDQAGGLSDDELEEWKRTRAAEIDTRLHRTFGNKLATNVEVTALAFADHFGRTLGELVRELQAHLPEDEWDPEEQF